MTRTLFALIAATTLATAAARAEATTDSRIATLCGVGHQNELVSADDLMSNPAGIYVVSLGVQIDYDDPRLIGTNDAAHLCTRPAATPAMDASQAAARSAAREVRWLFVPFSVAGGSIR